MNYRTEVLLWVDCRTGNSPDFFRGTHRFEGARDDLTGARAADIVSRLGFEQLGVREDDAELIVQAMEEEPQFG